MDRSGPAVTWPTLRLSPPAADREWAITCLWDAGTTGVQEHDDGTLTAGFPSEALACAAGGQMDRAWQPAVAVVVGDEWMDTWRDGFEPFTVGPFDIVPAWRAPGTATAARPERHRLLLDPGRAFGTGAHPSTRLVLEALPALVGPGDRVLDVGCGSGVLAVAAALLGATVVAVDIDPHAVDVTRTNAVRNGVAHAIQATLTPVQALAEQFTVVLANILAPTLVELAPALEARTARDGTLVLSGLIEDQAERVIDAVGRPVRWRRAEAPWVALALAAG